MRITKIKIKNYRSFDNSENLIELPNIKSPISIVGCNNSGKSNFLKAILIACGHRDYGQKFTEDDFYFRDIANNIDITVEFDTPVNIPTIYSSDTTKDKKCFGAQFVGKKAGEEIQAFSYALDQDGNLIRNQEQIKGRSLPVLINQYKDKLNIFYINFQNLEQYLKINSYSLLGKVMKEVKLDFKQPDNKIKTNKGEEVIRLEYFNKLLKYINNSLLRTEMFSELLKKIEGTIEDGLELNPNDISLSFSLPKSDDIYDSMEFRISDAANKPPIPLENLGDGFRSMLVIAILKVLLNTNEGQKIIILEEPETFLHENFQEYFYNILRKLAKNNQVIYTTHSKKFVNIFKPKSILRFNNSDYVKTIVVNNSNPKIYYPKTIDGHALKKPKDFPKYMRTLEPNLGNIIFSNKVIVVEGPHDLMAYKHIFNLKVKLSLQNITIVCAWGKDPIVTVVNLCKRFEIPVFVIHDWDINDDVDPNTKTESDDPDLKKQLIQDKSQWTKNQKILNSLGDITNVHHNKRHLEDVLGIEINKKGPISVYEKIFGMKFEEITIKYPKLIDDNLLDFVGITKNLPQN